MDDTPSGTKRRVYDLPQELVDRIVEFQKDRGLPSEVEAARRLLDQALKARDTVETIIGRYLTALTAEGLPSDAAKHVLVGHPLIKSLRFNEEFSIDFLYEKDGKGATWVTVTDADSIIMNDVDRSEYGARNLRLFYDASKPLGKRLAEHPEVPF